MLSLLSSKAEDVQKPDESQEDTESLIQKEGGDGEENLLEDEDYKGRKPLTGDFESIYSIAFVSLMEDTKKKLKEEKVELDNKELFFKCTMIFFIQMLILCFVISSAISNDDGLEYVKPDFQNMVLRLLTAYLFHLGNFQEVRDSYKKFKFIRYNAYYFKREELKSATLVC